MYRSGSVAEGLVQGRLGWPESRSAASVRFYRKTKIVLSCQTVLSTIYLSMSKQNILSETIEAAEGNLELSLFQALRRLQQDAEMHAKRLARFGGLRPVQLNLSGFKNSMASSRETDVSR